ncbi:hypothetical protein V7654_12515 [Bacillus sp. JJ1609]|uniref:hypothetical protein n=1 Tax=Bacillus sp. JJ1609 TaxID=3122977 RepID=UPI002FFEA181
MAEPVAYLKDLDASLEVLSNKMLEYVSDEELALGISTVILHTEIKSKKWSTN